jgi:branched-chain amino acid transport system permease protein
LILIYYFLVLTAIYIFMGWSLYLPYRVGHLNFLSITIMAISAYFTGVASREWDFPFILILVLGMLIGIIIGYGVSLLVGDAPCFTVVIVGLTSMFIIKTVIENWDFLGGSIGFFGIPTARYLTIWAYILLIGTGYLISLIDNSQIARKASVIFHDRQLALSLGIQRKKIATFFHSFSGMLAGLSGVLYASLIGGLTIDFFGFGIVGTLMAILFVGGYSTMWGIVLAAPLLGGIPILLPDTLIAWKQVIYGGLLIIMICFRTQGLITRKHIINIKNISRKEKHV